jgi:hypothetical protein
MSVYLQAVKNRAFIETVKVSFFFLSGVEVLQELGVEVSHDFEIWYRGLNLDSK